MSPKKRGMPHRISGARQKRLGEISRLLVSGQTRKQIANQPGVVYSQITKDVALLRSRGELPGLIPPKYRHDISREKAERIEKFTRFAKSVIEGKAQIKPGSMLRRPREFKAFSTALCRNPLASYTKLAKQLGIGESTAFRWRRLLVQQGKIPGRKGAGEKAAPPVEHSPAFIKCLEKRFREMNLTDMEGAVWLGLVAGFSGAEIGRQLGFSRETTRKIKEGLKERAVDFF